MHTKWKDCKVKDELVSLERYIRLTTSNKEQRRTSETIPKKIISILKYLKALDSLRSVTLIIMYESLKSYSIGLTI